MNAAGRDRLWTALFALIACAGPRPRPDPPPIDLVIEHAAPGRFVARIEAGAAREVRFVRRSAGREGWRARNAGGALPLVRDAGSDVLRSTAPLGRIEIDLPQDERPPEKDYRAFLEFSRGGVLVYSGQVAAEIDGAFRPQRITLVPLPGETVIAQGRIARGPLRIDVDGDGTYACFCTVDALDDERVTAVVDAGMWPEAAGAARALLPPLFRLYEERLGARLPWRPTVFISGKVAGGPRSIDMGGGTLDALIQIHLGLGSERSVAEPDIARDFEGNVAHEAAHLWAGQLFRPLAPRGDWMYEGAADVLSWRALILLGRWTGEAMADRAARAASVCILGGGSGPLAQAKVKVWYGCGAMVTLIAEASARVRDPAADAFSLWRAVHERARGGGYEASDLFAGFAAAGADATLLARLRARVEGTALAPSWEELMSLAGLRPRSVPPPPEGIARVRRDVCGSARACPEARWVALEGLWRGAPGAGR